VVQRPRFDELLAELRHYKNKGKGRCIAVKERTPHRATERHLSYGITCHPTEMNALCLNLKQRKQINDMSVLDLSTPKGWKAELT